MKPLKNYVLLTLLSAGLIFSSCSKKDTVKPATDNLVNLEGTWSVSVWGGVPDNTLTFNLASGSTTALVTVVPAQAFNFAVGDKLLTNITSTGTGTYSAMGKYTYGTDNVNVGTRAAVLTLQNNNMQLTVDYPAINASFGEIIYIYTKTIVLP